MNNNIDFYNQKSEELFQQYQSLSFESFHASWLEKLELHHYKTALDIGAGSGRDALALANLGLTVTAIEPAQSLKAKAMELTGKKVNWLTDTLPELSLLKQNTYDLILVSAVWMHLTAEQQIKSLKRISALLNIEGVVIITLRHGSFDDNRKAFQVNATQLIKDGSRFGLKLVQHDKSTDKLNRREIYWETIVFNKEL